MTDLDETIDSSSVQKTLIYSLHVVVERGSKADPFVLLGQDRRLL